jgi:hypothetical protein
MRGFILLQRTKFYFRVRVICYSLLHGRCRLTFGIRQWHDPLFDGNPIDRSFKKCQMMAFGTDSTWISVSETGEVKFSSNLKDSYGSLTAKFDATDLTSVEQIVLGAGGCYFIQRGNKTNWKMPPGVSRHVNMAENADKINVCALGMSGSYVIQLSNGSLYWDLKGHYAGLLGRLEKYDRRREAGSERNRLLVSLPPQVGTRSIYKVCVLGTGIEPHIRSSCRINQWRRVYREGAW